MHTDVTIERIAATQHGIVTRGQLLAAGVTPRMLHGRIAAGRLHVLHRGVYRVGPVTATHATILGAVLACGPGAVLSHASAAAHWGMLPPAEPDASLHVTAPRGFRRRVKGVTLHRRTLAPFDVTTSEAVPLTVPVRTILDLASDVGPSELERAIARAERAGLLRCAELTAAAAQRRTRGAPRVRALLHGRDTPALTRSEAEARLLQLIRRGELPRPRVNAPLHGFEVDFLWPAEQLVVEVDGFAYHASAQAFERDRRRDAALTAAGLRVIRLTWNDIVQRPEATLVTLARALSRR